MNLNLFDQVKEIALNLGIKRGNFYVWKYRQEIPLKHRIAIANKLQAVGKPVTDEQLKNLFKGQST